MTKKKPSPSDSARSAERIFDEKAKWHRRKARASFARKLAVLDKLFEDAKGPPNPGPPDTDSG